ncbi:unnamed protein product [Amoebophrya sp. A120]|nr:unnamed protein product [Amoebophrya sp. A120]|eukprot:GSA120T00008094001.1
MLILVSAGKRYAQRSAAGAAGSATLQATAHGATLAPITHHEPNAYANLRKLDSADVEKQLRIDRVLCQKYMQRLSTDDQINHGGGSATTSSRHHRDYLKPACGVYDDNFWNHTDLQRPSGRTEHRQAGALEDKLDFFAKDHIRILSGGYGWVDPFHVVNVEYPPLLLEYDFRPQLDDYHKLRAKKRPRAYTPPQHETQRMREVEKYQKEKTKHAQGYLAEFWRNEPGFRDKVLRDLRRVDREDGGKGNNSGPPYRALNLNLREHDANFLQELVGENTLTLLQVTFAGIPALQVMEAKGALMRWLVAKKVQEFSQIKTFAKEYEDFASSTASYNSSGGVSGRPLFDFKLRYADENEIVFDARSLGLAASPPRHGTSTNNSTTVSLRAAAYH